MSDMDVLRRLRAEVPAPHSDDLEPERARLLVAIELAAAGTRGRPVRRPAGAVGPSLIRRLVIPVAAAVTLAAGIGAAAVVGGSSGAGPNVRPDRVRPVSAVTLLDLAAVAAERSPELRPRPDQFVYREERVVQSVSQATENGAESRFQVVRTERSWLSATGSRQGAVVFGRHAVSPFPGWPLPRSAAALEPGPTTMSVCGQVVRNERTDHQYLSGLPTDPVHMRGFLYGRPRAGAAPDDAAFLAASSLLSSAHVPAKQAAAVYRAIATIPGVTLVPDARDAAGRSGIAVGRADALDRNLGVRRDLIFDTESYRFLGARLVVIDAKRSQTPVGSVIDAFAELKVEVVDRVAVETRPGPDCKLPR